MVYFEIQRCNDHKRWPTSATCSNRSQHLSLSLWQRPQFRCIKTSSKHKMTIISSSNYTQSMWIGLSLRPSRTTSKHIIRLRTLSNDIKLISPTWDVHGTFFVLFRRLGDWVSDFSCWYYWLGKPLIYYGWLAQFRTSISLHALTW